VDVPTIENIFEAGPKETELFALVDAFSYGASLDRAVRLHRLVLAIKLQLHLEQDVTLAVHRFEESIGGRTYTIEVKAVDRDRWRAYIVRLPGVPTALMPFYGPTPADAAHELSKWLTKAHERVSKPAGSA